MKYISAKDAGVKWNISQRRVAILCSEKRIDGATMVGNMWLIPDNAKKPIDGRSLRTMKKETMRVKPFLKWAGGKGQLLCNIRKMYPEDMGINIKKYAEPFVGGGAVLFDILTNFDLEKVYISDVNAELINTYKMIRDHVEQLIDELELLSAEYIPMDMDNRKRYYYDKRQRFNDLKINDNEGINIEKAGLFIFLNRTCFNGLYRVNKKGLYNVPMGAYKNPNICDASNLRNIASSLKNVIIICGDYKECESFVDKNTFVYFDPPYRPLTPTASFTSYTENIFDDNSQAELARFVDLLHEKGARIVVSNSDPKNSDENDCFFDNLYKQHKINRVDATRMINCNAKSRGKISELLIVNY